MENADKFMELCALAAREEDPEKLRQLIDEILRLLDEGEKKARLKQSNQPTDHEKP